MAQCAFNPDWFNAYSVWTQPLCIECAFDDQCGQALNLTENVAYKRGGALPGKMADPEIIMVKIIVSVLATCMLYTGHAYPLVNE